FSPALRATSATAPAAQPAAHLPYSEFSQMIENEMPVDASAEAPPQVVVPSSGMDPMPEFTLRPSHAPAPRLDFNAPPLELTPAPRPSGRLMRHLSAHGEFPPDAIPAPEISLSVLSELRPLGQIHESFIVAASRDGLWIIDQHVAHERILFEQVMRQRA